MSGLLWPLLLRSLISWVVCPDLSFVKNFFFNSPVTLTPNTVNMRIFTDRQPRVLTTLSTTSPLSCFRLIPFNISSDFLFQFYLQQLLLHTASIFEGLLLGYFYPNISIHFESEEHPTLVFLS